MTVFDAPPPGGGLKTDTCDDTMIAISAAVICAARSLTLINCVVRSGPLQRTSYPDVKFVPRTVNWNAGPPATAETGLSCVMVGAPKVIASWSVFDVPPAGAG